MGGPGVGWKGGWRAKGGFFHTKEQKSNHCVLMEVQKGACTVYLSGRDGCWQQFHKCSLISVP